MSKHREYPGKDTHRSATEPSAYVEALRDASLQIEEKVEELSLLRRVGDIVGCAYEPEAFYRILADILLEETNAENCSLMNVDDDTGMLVLKVARGRNDDGTFFDDQRASEVAFALGEGVAGIAALERKTTLINDVSRDRRFKKRPTRFVIGSLLSSPLISQQEVLGVINISHSQSHAFGESSRRVMDIVCTFAGSILGSATAHAMLRKERRWKKDS